MDIFLLGFLLYNCFFSNNMTLTIRIYFIRFLFIALGGDLPGMYLVFFFFIFVY